MLENIIQFKDKTIENIFNAYPEKIREKLLYIREIIFEVEKESKVIWKIEETLKWWEPSYINSVWSTVRIDKISWSYTEYAVYFNCKTTLISTFQEIFWNQFTYSWGRALVFNVDDEINRDNLKHCIYLSLTYFKK